MVQATPIDSGTQTQERRNAVRAKFSGTAMAVFSGGIDAGRLAAVTLVDASTTGLGVMSPFPVDPGASFSIMPEAGAFPRQVGIVIRCDKTEHGYRLGLRSRMRAAA